MKPQLSMSSAVSQPVLPGRKWMFVSFVFFITALTVQTANSSDFELQIRPLSAIDKQYMVQQRAAIEALANRLGRRLSGTASRDLDTLQRIIDRRWIDPEDAKTQQAMGIVFGDLLAKELSFDWVVYRDRAGRSRALRYRDQDIYIFPITLISRRLAAKADTPVKALFDEQLRKQRKRLPGARWMPTT
jgi:hypothetical protein